MRKYFLLMLVLLLILPSCKNADLDSSRAAAERDIYTFLLDDFFTSQDIQLIIIKDMTSIDKSSNSSVRVILNYAREEFGSAIEAATLTDFRITNIRKYDFNYDISIDGQYVFIGEQELTEIFDQENGWEQFYRAYPESSGLITFSRVGFNRQHNQALVYLGIQSDYLAGRGYLILLTKENDHWNIENITTSWIS